MGIGERLQFIEGWQSLWSFYHEACQQLLVSCSRRIAPSCSECDLRQHCCSGEDSFVILTLSTRSFSCNQHHRRVLHYCVWHIISDSQLRHHNYFRFRLLLPNYSWNSCSPPLNRYTHNSWTRGPPLYPLHKYHCRWNLFFVSFPFVPPTARRDFASAFALLRRLVWHRGWPGRKSSCQRDCLWSSVYYDRDGLLLLFKQTCCVYHLVMGKNSKSHQVRSRVAGYHWP